MDATIRRILFTAAEEAVLFAEGDYLEGARPKAVSFGGTSDEVCVSYVAGGVARHWLVLFQARLDAQGYDVGTTTIVREVPARRA